MKYPTFERKNGTSVQNKSESRLLYWLKKIWRGWVKFAVWYQKGIRNIQKEWGEEK